MSSSTQGPSREDREDSPPLALDPSTLALLNSFYQEREQAEQEFRDLEEKAHKRMLKAKGLDEGQDKKDVDDQTSSLENGDEEDKMMSVDEFRKLFQEDWQLSQFWYTASFASQLCRFIYSFATPSTRIAFLCCPTSFVAFQNQNPLPDVWLLEYDGRFGLLGSKFVHYDLEEPDKIPKNLWGTVDVAIADPPFLNEITNKHLSAGLKNILKPDGKLILLTSTSVSALPQIYSEAPIGPLHETSLRVEHAGGIQNEFRVWTSWKFEGEREGVRLVDDPARLLFASSYHSISNMSGRRLYVGRVPPDAVKRDLEDHFASHGRLVDIRLMNGFAFVEYDRISDAEQAVQDLGQKDFMGERLLVEFAKPPRERDPRDDRRGPPPPPRYGERDFDRGYDRGGYDSRGGPGGYDRFDRPPPARPVARGGTGYRLVVSNLREGTSWQDLKDFARQVGNCAFSDVDRRDPTVGYIEYALRGDADEAVRKLNSTELNGVVVNVAEDANAPAPRAAPSSSSRYDDRAGDRGYSSRRDDGPSRRSYDDRRRTRSPSPPRRSERDASDPRRSQSPRRSRSPERERDGRD